MTGVKKVGLVAAREFTAAVANRGFVVGLMLMPALIALASVFGPRLMNSTGAAITGQVAVIDRTGRMLPALRETIAPAAIRRRQAEAVRRTMADAPPVVRDNAPDAGALAERVRGPVPDLVLVERLPGEDLQAVKRWLSEEDPAGRHTAVLVIHRDAVVPADGRTRYGSYDLFVPPNLDDRVETVIFESVREALVNARVSARGLDRAEVEAVMRVARTPSVTVTRQDERETNSGFNRALPLIFGALLIIGVMIAGQTLLTQMIEEKSSRVIEVLLSAVSPMELMAGKILGQMAVSLLVLGLYLAMGLSVLTSFAMVGLLDPFLVVYLVIFFLIAYLLVAAVFGAVGAAVNDMREAQSLMMPLMVVLFAPWIFAPFISREPNAPFSVALSFIPPVNPFVMMLRLTSAAPPPAWQAWASIAIGIAATYATIWFAAKIFKIGVLMHGKPPDIATLIRWARSA